MGITIPEKIRIGTRGSLLALAQTDLLIEEIHKLYPDIVCEKVIIKTTGDKILDKPLVEFGGKGVFVTEFEEAIREGRIDYAVHSAKDMPMELLEGLGIVCVLPREDVRDVLILRKGTDITTLTSPVIGTGSLRRQTQLAELYSNVTFQPLRGNVPTRLEKLKAGEYDGIVLAAAGLNRLGLSGEEDFTYIYLDEEVVIPAGGQAIIAVEGRVGDDQTFLEKLTDKRAAIELETERYILKCLNAGCHEAIGVRAKICGVAGENEAAKESEIQIRIMKECGGTVYRQTESGRTTERFALAEKIVSRK